MDFGYLVPPPSLAPLLKAVWFARGSRVEFDHAEPIVPDGCVELVFNLAAPFEEVRQDGLRVRQPRDLIVGPTLRPTTAVPTGDVDLLGLRFWPGRTSGFFRAAMSDFADQIVPMSAALPNADLLLDDLRGFSMDRRVSHLADAFESRARPSSPERPAVARAIEAIGRRCGNVSVTALSSIAGVSQRQLERQFREEVGLGVKHLARITRMQHALRVMGRHVSWSGAAIAAYCGYADQAHLIRECRELTGTTPSRLVTTETTLATLMRGDA